MKRKQRPAELPADVRKIHARIERWRKTRKRRTAMPEQMWRGAVSLAKVHGVYWTARALRLSYESLKRRVGATPGNGQGGQKNHPGFVEIDPAPLMGFAQPTGSMVEMSDAEGAKLMIRLTDGVELDLAGLAEAFWGRRS
jgi:hypothetical protein